LEDNVQLAFYFDQTRCTGCHTCAVACKDWHDLPAELVQWRRVSTCEEGKFPNVLVRHLSISCAHCASPACAAACPEDAISKRPGDGLGGDRHAVDRALREESGVFLHAICRRHVDAYEVAAADGLLGKPASDTLMAKQFKQPPRLEFFLLLLSFVHVFSLTGNEVNLFCSWQESGL